MTENEFDEVFEIETLQDWQMSAGQIDAEEPAAGGGCNSNSTNNN
jgi:hypothetical protein